MGTDFRILRAICLAVLFAVVVTSVSAQTVEFKKWQSSSNYSPRWSPDGKTIAFYSFREGDPQIFVMNADGSGQTNLSANGEWETSPIWSPDGARILYRKRMDDHFDNEIWVMNADGSQRTRLTRNPGSDNPFSWIRLPDGTDRIAFKSEKDGQEDLYIMQPDGSNQTRITNSLTEDNWPSFSPDGKRIVFLSKRDNEKGDLYLMDVDGSEPRRITFSGAHPPAWSPDGRWIAYPGPNKEIHLIRPDGSGQRQLSHKLNVDFVSWSADSQHLLCDANRNGNPDIHVVNADGSNLTNLTRTATYNRFPVVAPDGKSVFFEAIREGELQIHRVDLEGSRVENLFTTGNSDASATVAPSPDGQRLAFVGDLDDGNQDIYLLDIRGKNLTRLTAHTGTDSFPSWSPDGKRIVFDSERDGAAGQIYISSLEPNPWERNDRSGQMRLGRSESLQMGASFSPDGRQILYASDAGGDWDCWVMDADGGNPRNLTNTPGLDLYPSWSADGKRIAFVSARVDENRDIYVMNADGSNPTRWTTHPARDFYPKWSPDSKSLVFDSNREGNYHVYVIREGDRPRRLTPVSATRSGSDR